MFEVSLKLPVMRKYFLCRIFFFSLFISYRNLNLIYYENLTKLHLSNDIDTYCEILKQENIFQVVFFF